MKCLPPICVVACIASSALAQVQVDFTQSSDPPAIFTSSSVQVSTGTTVSTIAAPIESGTYHFVDWVFNGIRQVDDLGRAVNPQTFVIDQPVTAVARYLTTTNDVDGDRIEDWYEQHFFNTLTNNPAADGDGDGFSLLEEFTRDYHPNLVETIADGGISQRGSALKTVILDTNFVIYARTSSPIGLSDTNQVVQIGSTQVLPDLYGANGSYQFAQWFISGVRVADDLGRSVGGLSFVIAGNTTVTAMYSRTTDDTDNDGIPDWFEWQFYGTLTNNAVSDTDGDGFSLFEEYNRDYHPGLVDTIADGGISQRGSKLLTYLNANYTIYRETSNPPGLIDVQAIVLTNATQILSDPIATSPGGYQFGQWLFNGVRIADDLGRSVGNLPVTLTGTNSNVTANFYRDTDDTDGDGIPDWFEWQFYGSLSNSATSDTDGDGFSLLEEFNRDYHPGLVDTIADGGISQKSSELVGVDFRTNAFYTVNSSPPGFVSASGFVPVGTVIQTTNFSGNAGAYIFGHWSLNGVRQQDPQGFPLTQITFTVLNNTTATASFYLFSADTDGDGMPDWWEDHYLSNPTNGVAGADADGDGSSNLSEYIAGTNPRSAASVLAITAFNGTPEGWAVSFPSVAGKVYRIEYSTDLRLSWQTLVDNVLGDGSIIQVIDPVTGPQRFYRVRIAP